MIQITPQMKIFLAVEPVDFRKGIDGLSGICRGMLQSDPFSGALFVFRNRRKTALKILAYDGQGFWLCQKRLSKGRFEWWPDTSDGGIGCLMAYELQMLLWNGNPKATPAPDIWKPLQNFG